MTEGMGYQLPHSIEAEQNVIGVILNWPENFIEVASKLNPQDFYSAPMRETFEGMGVIDSLGRRIELFEIQQYLEAQYANTEWLKLLVECQQNAYTTANLDRYIEVVREHAIERRMLSGASHIQQLATAADISLDNKLDTAQRLMSELSTNAVTRGPKHVSGLMTGLDAELQDRANQGGVIGLSTGLGPLDRRLKGLKPTDLILIAARPSMGKTTLAMNIAENAAKIGPVVVFSMEMSDDQLRDRSLSSLGRIPFEAIQDGSVLSDPEHAKHLGQAREQLATRNLYIDDSASLTIHEIRARSRNLAHQHGAPALIVVDYIQLMTGQGDSREREVADISRGLKALAKEMECPVIALSQLNRSLEQRHNKRPTLSDLRESGALEQDADIVMFIYRDEVYNKNTEWLGVAEIITAKFRNGKIGSNYLSANLKNCRFDVPPAIWTPPVDAPRHEQKGFE